MLDLNGITNTQTAAQLFSPETRTLIKGQPVTIGAWVWSDAPARVFLGFNSWGGWRTAVEFEAPTNPQLVTTTILVPDSATGVYMELGAAAKGADPTNRVYFDGVFLIPQAIPDASTVEFSDHILAELATAQGNLSNLVSNPSMERNWLRFRSRVVGAVDPRLPLNLDYTMSAFSNLSGTGWYFSIAMQNLMETFWARFGWGNVPLLGAYSYAVLVAVSVIGLVGAARALFRGAGKGYRDVIIFLALAGLTLWAQAVLRGISTLFETNLQAVARYAYPAIVPTTLLLTAGWTALTGWFTRRRQVRMIHFLIVYLGFLAGLNLLAIASILVYYA
jgi:hypothetical protein